MAEALLDTNVLIAALVERHPHHEASLPLVGPGVHKRFAVAAHCYAEAYSHLTRRRPSAAFQWSPDDARLSLASIANHAELVGLSPAQTLNALHAYASNGGIGARLYDWLIGEAAIQAGIGTIITWNFGHFSSLFPRLVVVTPAQALA